MTSPRLLPLPILLAAVGCQPAGPPPAAPTPVTAAGDDHDDHDHPPGPHGGTVFGLGRHHIELCVAPETGEVTVFVLSGNLRRPVAVAADALTLSLDRPAGSVELRAVPQQGDPAGKASRFVGTLPALAGVGEFAGTVTGTADGRVIRGRFATGAAHPE